MREAQAFGLAVRSGITMPLCTFGHMTDPVITDPSLYRVVWENDRVRIHAQEHQGRNVGDTASHSIFIELKEPRPAPAPQDSLDPTTL
jgi:hypothetical protein